MGVLLWLADIRCKLIVLTSKSTCRIDTCCSTSPSLYIQLMGTAAVHDQCTTVGPNLTNPIITLAPGELSTWAPYQGSGADDFEAVGDVWQDPSDVEQYDIGPDIFPLEIKDLACPTWGLGKSTSADGTVITTIGPPWLPLIIPPIEMFSLDPIWAAMCTGVASDTYEIVTLGLFDPPIALTPASLLAPTPPARPTPTPVPTPADPTTIPVQSTSYAEAAKPASLPNDPAAPPAKTRDPGKDSPTQSPVIASADPASLPDSPAASPDNNGDPPSAPKVPSVPAVAGDPQAETIAPSSSDPDPPSDDSQQSPSDPKVPIIPVSPPGENPQAQTQGLGAIIYNAFGKSGPEIDGPSPMLLPPQSIFTIGAQTFTADPKGFKVNNAAMVPGGTAQTVDGTKISLDPSGVLAIGSSTISLAAPVPSTVLAVAGQTLTANPSAFSIAGTIISAGGPAVTIEGTAISLDQSGALAIGSNTISLMNPSPTPVATEVFSVAGQTFTPNPSAFSIAGTTISANGPAVTISGTRISLGENGALEIGSSTISLPTLSDTPSNRVFTVAGQTFTPNPLAFSIAGTTISADGPAVTISGTRISLGENGALEIGSSTISLPSPSDPPPNKAYTVAGQTFTPNPSAFPIAGTIVSAGGAAVTVDGTIISLGPSGALAIGSSTVDLPPISYAPSTAYTVAGQTFTPNPSAFSIAGTTISAGGPAATIDGTIVSLQPSGTLLVGASTIPLLTPPVSSDINIDGFDVQAQSSYVVVDGITLSAAAPGVTISGTAISLEAGGSTLDIGTGRFALPTATGAANGSVNLQDFTGGQGKGLQLSFLLVCVVCGTFVLLMGR